LCRLQTHLNCSYTCHYITSGADSVVVRAPNWQTYGPGLIRADAAGGLIYLVYKSMYRDCHC
jgi:hypothetical protein